MQILETIYDAPWWMLALIAAVGIWVLIIANRQLDKTLRWVGAGILLLAVGLGISSFVLETDVESVERRTHELIDAVVAKDWLLTRSLLDPRARLFQYGNRDQILAGAQRAVDRWEIRSATITALTSEQVEPYITTRLSIVSRQGATGDYPYRSDWQLDWVEGDEGWVVVTITPVAGPGADPGRIQQRLP